MQVNGFLQRFPLLRIALYLAIGIIVGEACYPTLGTGFWAICASIGLVAALLFKPPKWQNCCILFVTLTLGAALISRSNQKADRPLPHGISHFEGIITSTPTLKGKTWRCDLMLTRLNGQALHEAMKVKTTILNDPNRPMQLQVCNGIIATSVLNKPQNHWKNASFDYALWLRRHGYQAETFIPYNQFHTAKFPITLSRWQRITLHIRQFRDHILRHFTTSTDIEQQDKAILQAMVLGHREAISKATREAYSRSGASHILALSGLHIGIIFSIFLLVFRRNALGILLSIIAAWAFALFVGLPSSAIRSAVMLTIYALSTLSNEENQGLNSLALAALVVLCLNP